MLLVQLTEIIKRSKNGYMIITYPEYEDTGTEMLRREDNILEQGIIWFAS